MPEYSQGFMVFNHDAYPKVSGTEFIESGVGTSGWPSGNYLHHFLFSDGSVKSFVTPKL